MPLSSPIALWRALLPTLLVCLAPFQFGLDVGIVSGLQAMRPFLQVFGYADPTSPIGWDISPRRQQIIASLMTLGAAVSACGLGLVSRCVGRRTLLAVASLLSVVATVLMQSTHRIGGLYVARFMIGLANGILVGASQLWVVESSAPGGRGWAIGVWEVAVTTGTLVGTIIDNFAVKSTERDAYVLPLAVLYVPVALLLAGLYFAPESPRWLLMRGRADDAQQALRRLRPDSWNVQTELAEMRMAIEAMAHVVPMDLVRTRIDRRRTLLSVGALLIQAATGSMFMIAFGTYFFTIARRGEPFEDTCLLSSAGLLAIVINTVMAARWGYRRWMILGGVLACATCFLIMASTWTALGGRSKAGNVLVGFSILYVFVYNGTVATYAWLAAGELPSQRLRSYTFGVATAVAFLGAWLTTYTAPYFINPAALNYGPKYTWIWFGSCAITAVWVYLYLPETKDRKLEEIDEMFEADIPANKFRTYRCVGKWNPSSLTLSEGPPADKRAATESVRAVMSGT